MSKRKPIGIIPLTETEQKRTLTPQEKHEELSHLIPFQDEACVRYVRVERVAAAFYKGWILKAQTPLHSKKALLAMAVNAAVEEEKLTPKEAKALYASIEKSTSETAPEVQQEIFKIINKEI